MLPPFFLREKSPPEAVGGGLDDPQQMDLQQAASVLSDLAGVYFQNLNPGTAVVENGEGPQLEERYKALVEQIPAVVFLAYLDRGIGEAYVSPQIEATLGFSQKEWLEDPIRWYQQIHPADKQRWSVEAAAMFLSGKPLTSAYRVMARDGRVMWFHCEAKMIRQQDGRPWFIHGVAFDITELKRVEQALQQERNLASAIVDTVGALVVVLDPDGRIVSFNRACELTTGYLFGEVRGQRIQDLFMTAEERERFNNVFQQMLTSQAANDYESHWATRTGGQRLISWSTTALTGNDGAVQYVIATGIDVTEQKRLEKAILEISGREQRRIGQDLHDGLGQHLTGIAFMSKVLEQRLTESSLPESAEAAKIVKLVNEAINTTRELARGLLPVLSKPNGLMSALEQLAIEVKHVFRINCFLRCDEPVLIRDDTVATHLYHIAQEAVNNAIKHGHAKKIILGLNAMDGRGGLTISDDGSGISNDLESNPGMGLHIMSYRAKMISGSLEICRGAEGGTEIRCSFPAAE